MQTYLDKINLLQEMVSFALVDGNLHNKEYDFIEMIALELCVNKADLLLLYENKLKIKVIKDEFTRICQFYRLALLMFADGILHPEELLKINQISLQMGLNPHATKRVLKLLEHSENKMVDGEVLIAMFTEQYN